MAESKKRSRDSVDNGNDENGGSKTTTAMAQAPADDRTPANARTLRKGMVFVKGFLSDREQTELAGHVHRLGAQPAGGFYCCHNEKTKRMRMMNLGLKTDGGKHLLKIPREWTDFAVRACRLANDLDPTIPVLHPDMCVVNHYTSRSRLGWHRDMFSQRDSALPVVSLSLGEPALFQYRSSWKKTAPVISVTLEGGDALVFGGRSRGIIHGVPQIGAALKTNTKNTVTQASPLGAGEGAKRESSVDHKMNSTSCQMPEEGRYNLNFREL